MYSLDIGDGEPVVSVFVVCVDLKVRQTCGVARCRHQIAAVAHEVVFAFVEGCVVRISRCYAC